MQGILDNKVDTMRVMDTFFATIFAILATVGGTVAPVYQCLCPNGTTTVQVGQRFCVDADRMADADAETTSCGDHAGCQSNQILLHQFCFVSSDVHPEPPKPLVWLYSSNSLDVFDRVLPNAAGCFSTARAELKPTLLRSVILLV